MASLIEVTPKTVLSRGISIGTGGHRTGKKVRIIPYAWTFGRKGLLDQGAGGTPKIKV